MIKLYGEEVETSVWNGGECHVKVPVKAVKAIESNNAFVEAYLYNANDLMFLMLTVDAIRQIKPDMWFRVVIYHFPYARQDRVCNPGEAFSLQVVTQMINSLMIDELYVYDPHSNLTPDMLKNCKVVDQGVIIRSSKLSDDIENMIIVAPDKGAEEKVMSLAKLFGTDAVYCTKVRNLETGDITETHVPDIEPTKKYIVVDDICDGGRTFNRLAEKFAEKGVTKDRLFLYVTHGIFSYGFDELSKHYQHIYCYHAFPSVPRDTDILTILNEKERL
ncbi:ribose-phosphate pyrophosphokinase [Candidatus Pacearchaeota archaeon]|nr:ribose-phosphate pyrophosphokinase [Candidatus Pacearchaeota archaeon]